MSERSRFTAAAAFLLLTGCRERALDTVADPAADPAVWKRDADKIAGALPRAVGAFVPHEAVSPFWTTYGTGPVFGASCVYADGPRQLLLRVESGNIGARSAAALDPSASAEGKPAGREVTVKGRAALARWSEVGQDSEVTFLVARRYLVQMRVVPAKGAGEAPTIAESFDAAPLEALALEGVR